MLVPIGVTPPPIISAMDPVTTTAGSAGSSVFQARAHRPFGAVAAQLFLAQPRHHDGQLMRRQRVGVVQHARDRQVLAAHRAVDHHLQALDRAEGIDRPPVAARPVMILDQHDDPRPENRMHGSCMQSCMDGAWPGLAAKGHIISSALAAFAALSSFF